MAKRIIFFFVLLLQITRAGENSAALVRVNLAPLSPAEIRALLALEWDITHIEQDHSAMDVVLDEAGRQALRQRGIEFVPMIADLAAFARQLRDKNYFSYFHSNEEIQRTMRDAVALHPRLAELHDIGDSYLKVRQKGGHDIWALKISDDVATDDSTEADILYMANIHAREIITPEILIFFMHYLLDNYGADPYVTHLVNNREIWLLPTVNPDGHEYVFTGDASLRDNPYISDPLWWRKNMQDNNNSSAFESFFDGVDLNRNFGYAWGLDNDGSSPSQTSATYRGSAPFSEPEAQVIRDFVRQRDFVISVSYHSYSNLWLYPWGHTFEPLPEPACSVFRALADSCVFYNNYTAQPAADLYTVNGDTDDWLYGDQGIWAFTPEVGHADIDHYFYPDTNRVLPLILENLGPNLFLAYAAGEEPIVRHQRLAEVLDPQPVFRLMATVTRAIVLTKPVGLDSSSFRLYFRPSGKPDFSSAPMFLNDSTGLFEGTIPGEALAGTIYYYVEASDSLGRRGTSPRAAPPAVDSFYVRQPVLVQEMLPMTARTFELAQNYPNPFNSSTIIKFSLPKESLVSLDLFDVNGRFVANLEQGFYAAGQHQVMWNGRSYDGRAAASGIYYCRLQGALLQKSIKLLLLR